MIVAFSKDIISILTEAIAHIIHSRGSILVDVDKEKTRRYTYPKQKVEVMFDIFNAGVAFFSQVGCFFFGLCKIGALVIAKVVSKTKLSLVKQFLGEKDLAWFRK